MKKLPPYAQHLFKLQSPKAKAVYQCAIVFIGEGASRRAAEFHQAPYALTCTMFLPLGASPSHYRWPVANAEVYLVDTDESPLYYIKDCVRCLFRHDAVTVKYYSKYRQLQFDRKGIEQ